MRLALLSAVVLFSSLTQAQTDSFSEKPVEKTDRLVYIEGQDSQKVKLLIIPFEDKMFFTDLYRELTAANQINQEQIRNRLRRAIQLSTRSSMRDSLDIHLFLRVDSVAKEELADIHSAIAYDYVPVKKFDKKGKEIKPEKAPEKGIRNGQIVSERTVDERYMNTVVRKPEILRQLNDRYEVNRFLFINQLDIKHDLRDPNTAFLDPKRLIQVHYTFVDLYGKELGSGLAIQEYSGRTTNLDRIISDNMYKVAAQISKTLKPKPEKEKKKGKKKKPRSKTDME